MSDPEVGPAELKAFRSEFHLTKAALAARLGCALRTLEDWEAGRRHPPRMLGLALAAVARGVKPWRPMPVLGPNADIEGVGRVVDRLFVRAADSYLCDLEHQFRRCLSKDASPAERLLLAYIIDMSDGGNNRIEAVDDWSSRPRSGWSTVVMLRPELDGATPSFAFEVRYDRVAKQLAVFIDSHRPGERLAEKIKVEAALVERGVRVMSLSVNDILLDGEATSDTIQAVLSDIAEEVLSEAGHISRPWNPPERQ